MPVVYLHIGMPKTGTTTLQFFLGKNRKVLNKNGVDYPNASLFLTKLGYNPNRNALWVHQGYGKPKYDAYVQTLIDICKKHDTVVLSDEGIYHRYYRKPELIRTLKERLSAAGIDLKVVVYLRRQDDYLYSLWAQYVKEYVTDSFEDWLETGDNKAAVDYRMYLERLSDDIGEENLVVRPYEREQLKNKSINDDFLALLGLTITEEYTEAKADYNVSLQDIYLEVKRMLNHERAFGMNKTTAGKKPGQFRIAAFHTKAIVRAQEKARAEGTLQDRSCFPTSRRTEFMKEFEDGNRAVAQRHLKGSESLFTEPIKQVEAEPEHYEYRDVQRVLVEMLKCEGEIHRQTMRENKKLRDEIKRRAHRFLNRTLKKMGMKPV